MATILITQLTPNVTEKQLTDFFSFCGKITSLTFRSKGDVVEAVLTFEKESSATTGLLLNNAIIDGNPIKVVPYTEEHQEVHKQEDHQTKIILEKSELPDEEIPPAEELPEPVTVTEVAEEDITHRPGERTATAAIASLIANGYVLTMDALGAAKRLDEEKKISQTISEGGETMKNRAKQFDTDYHISESVDNAGKTISEKMNNIDQQFHISESTTAATTYLNTKFGELGASIADGVSTTFQSPKVQDTLTSINTWSSNVTRSIGDFFRPVGDSINREFDSIKEESARKIEEKQRARVPPPMTELSEDISAEQPSEPKPSSDDEGAREESVPDVPPAYDPEQQPQPNEPAPEV